MKKCVVVSALLVAASTSFGGTLNWNPVAGSDDFMAQANWNNVAFTTASDSLRVGGPIATYPNSASLAKLTTAFGVADGAGNLNDALVVGGYKFEGHFELACAASTAYFRSIIVGDTKTASTDNASTMVITSGTIANGPTSVDTGYMTIGRNNTVNGIQGVGYLYVNGGAVKMDRMTIGEQMSSSLSTAPGLGHVILQNNGVINLACQKTFDPVSYVGLKLNNGDFTWNDNGNSSVTTGALSVNTGKLIFQSTDNIFGPDGQGIDIVSGAPAGNGMATFSADASIDVTGLTDTPDWITLITAANGFTFADETLLTDASISEGWTYRTTSVTGGTALQVSIPEPATVSLLSIGALFLLRRRK